MKRFGDKTGKFGSLVSLIALSALLMLFAVNFPAFMASTAGQIFAGLWAVFALVMFSAHIVRLSVKRKHHVENLPFMAVAGKKDIRTQKKNRMVRAMRG
ncbi:MAG: hypothetical protein K0R55_1033 [Sporomusa sp.]|jgi:flagellar biogenesis protein FliO|nr:hypothetical protein [Sporomusa sp.]